MENATKALLIAAAILIVILIIALGMRIFNSTSGATKDAAEAGKTVSESTIKATNSFNNSIYEAKIQNILGENYRNETQIYIKGEDVVAINEICKNYNKVLLSGPSISLFQNNKEKEYEFSIEKKDNDVIKMTYNGNTR